MDMYITGFSYAAARNTTIPLVRFNMSEFN